MSDQVELQEREIAAEKLPWRSYVPGTLLIAMMWLAWIVRGQSDDGMRNWGVSAAALRDGRFATIPLHMVAHGALFHILMNTALLFQLAAIAVARLGSAPMSWLRFGGIFFLSGLAGMLMYLAIHPAGNVPMLGASGAIYGVLGLLVRTPPGSPPIAFHSPEMRQAAKSFAKDNLLMFALLTLPLLLEGKSGGVAWEAHLGGFLFGLLVGPRFVPQSISGV